MSIICSILRLMKPTKPASKPKPAPVHASITDALFRIELRQIYQIRLMRRIYHRLGHGNPAESQAMKDQIQRMIDLSKETTHKLEDAVDPQKE